jgi:hypothetical protein
MARVELDGRKFTVFPGQCGSTRYFRGSSAAPPWRSRQARRGARA